MRIEVLVFGPHPDDAEIGAGGLLLKMKSLGHTTGIVDMTHGDMGWGTPQERDRECDEAAKILGLDLRVNLDLPDFQVEDTWENRCKVATVIRKYRPEIVFAPYYDIPPGRGLGHNDHWKTGIVVTQGFNLAHLHKAPVEGEPYQAKAIFYYYLPAGVRPTFTVDVSPHFDDWMRALACHRTQFANPDRPKPRDPMPGLLEIMDSLARGQGWPIGARHAQSFLSASPLKIGDPLDLVKEVVPRP
ncbi:MAG TPA: PIG-L family deacetylase [Candidatus Eisenbacteria bacterium]|jgi:bacillithiol biosynthesis deacetylase BshB1